MIREDEAFWAGIAVATLMLGGGFSMLFLRALTGEGAVVLALGLMTMTLTMQLRAKPRRYVESWTPVEARSLTPSEPIESPTEPEPAQPETQAAEQQPSQPQEEATAPSEQPQAEPVESPQPPQPAQPEPPVEQKTEPPAPEAPKEEPIVVF